jgi:hypothetical protein
VSAREIAKLCSEQENAGEEQNWGEAEKLHPSLGPAFARARDFMAEKQTNLTDIQKAS